MKVGIAQVNGVVGDFAGNAKRLLGAYRECLELGAELVVTPELALAGYPPRDLAFKSRFVPQCLQALDYLSGEVGEVPLLVGYVDRNDSGRPGKPLRNAAAWLEGFEVRQRVWKTLLPTYDVFDERRYFEPGEAVAPVAWRGRRIGVTICEDLWTDDPALRPLYDRDPARELAAAGIDLLVNLSASPFHLGKPAARRDLLGRVARDLGAPVVWCNAVGANDELVFDGQSLVVGADGVVRRQFPGFREQCAVVDAAAARPAGVGGEVAEEQVHDALVLGLRDYAGKCGFSSVCLGLSGGIDSALVAEIAAAAVGPEHVFGLTMPGPFSSQGSVDDSLALARNLGIDCRVVPIGAAYDAVRGALGGLFAGLAEDVTEENLQARIRGMLLMAMSNKFGRLLLTTGNKSELAVGYCTIYGDMCGGLAVISDLPKTMVYQVARWVNRRHEVIPWSTIEKPPSAELRPGQTDQDTLPPYKVLDAILGHYVEEGLAADEIVARGFEEATVRWVQRRVDLNEWKRQQAAPGLRVTSKAFGIGRRMPIVQRFAG